MNQRIFPVRAVVAAAALALGGCQHQPAEEPPLKGASIGGPFTLIDQDGRRVSDTAFNGRYRLMYFGFANCPDACPTDLAKLGRALRLFEQRDEARGARVQPIFVTVDPERDTPAVLKAFVANFHPRLIGLTGTPQEIQSVERIFRVPAEKGPVGPGGSYNMNHLRIVYLMGPQGEPIAPMTPDQSTEEIASTLDAWVQ
jgi:protein SCO1